MKKNYPISGREIDYPHSANILSTTSLKGAISYVNDDFIRISGFTNEELIGKNHNIVRHPDMPPEAFADLWGSVKSGRSWMGMVKNRCKNGDHYWVSAFVTPIVHNGEVTEYQSVRTKPQRVQIERAEKVYAQLNAGKKPRELRGIRISLTNKLLGAVGIGALASFVLALLGNVQWTSALMMAVSMLLISGLLLLAFLSPLNRTIKRAKVIADSPLAQVIYTGRTDEVGALEYILKIQEAEAGGILGRIGDSARKLSEQASQLAAAVAQSSAGSRQQQEETEQVSTAIEQMSASIREVAANSQNTAQAAHQARTHASQGHGVVSDASSAMRVLAADIKQTASVVQSVHTSSYEISKILDVIRSIAEQTNLLALNAAIEAARASEHGRGFSVVADEVRSLAGRSHKATEDINQMIDILQKGVKGAVAAMENSLIEVDKGVVRSEKAAQVLEDIASGIATITDMSTQIASAVEEQSAVCDEVNRSISSIRSGTDNNVQAGHLVEQAAHSVSELSHSLRLLSDQFWSKRQVS
ncbi:methyl-accepting chemotaxis protein [Nitrincola sp. MINF-07-Sa-05]|uniref:methyl-accepting chemotaxis protein n=1 Tax=Nitrincola salilacus TaxID=3400273 RepID=UPI0039181A66